MKRMIMVAGGCVVGGMSEMRQGKRGGRGVMGIEEEKGRVANCQKTEISES